MSSLDLGNMTGAESGDDDFQLADADVYGVNPGEPTEHLATNDDPTGADADRTRACDCCGTHPGDPDPGAEDGPPLAVLNGRDIWCRLAHAGLFSNIRWKDA